MKRAWQRIIPYSVISALLYVINDWSQQAILRSGARPVTATSTFVAEHAVNSLELDWGIAVYAAVNVAAFLVYANVIGMARRNEFAFPAARRWALLAPFCISAFLIFLTPSLSQDLYSYIAHGYLGVTPGGNPLLQPAYVVGETPLGHVLESYGWHGRVSVSPYGILWTRIEMLIMAVSHDNVPLALILFKTTVVLATAGCAAFIWLILGRLRPQWQLLGTLVFIWNPMVIVEIAGEGHNDAVMGLFVLAALWACVASKPATSLVAQAMGVITKVVPIIFFPAQLMYLWHTRRSVPRLALAITIALLVATAIAAILYAPLWAGSHTLDGLINRASPASSASPLGGINFILKHSRWPQLAGSASFMAVAIPAALFVIWQSLRVKDATSLVRACVWISLAYVLLASPDYWPWYAFLPVALIAAAEPVELWWLVLLLSLPARFCAPLTVLYDHGFVNYVTARGVTTGLGASLPLVLLLYFAIRRLRLPQLSRP